MYKGTNTCIVCEHKMKFYVGNKTDEVYGEDYSITEKNNDGTFKCEVIVSCEKCGAKQKINRNIEFNTP